MPLPTQALEILEKLKVLTGCHSLLFPGRNDARKPMSEASINKVPSSSVIMAELLGTVSDIQ